MRTEKESRRARLDYVSRIVTTRLCLFYFIRGPQELHFLRLFIGQWGASSLAHVSVDFGCPSLLSLSLCPNVFRSLFLFFAFMFFSTASGPLSPPILGSSGIHVKHH